MALCWLSAMVLTYSRCDLTGGVTNLNRALSPSLEEPPPQPLRLAASAATIIVSDERISTPLGMALQVVGNGSLRAGTLN
jgi:hypothetical protein